MNYVVYAVNLGTNIHSQSKISVLERCILQSQEVLELVSIEEIIADCPPEIDVVAWVREKWIHPYLRQEVRFHRQTILDHWLE